VHAQDLEISDGGAVLAPVHYRPKSLQEKNRHWVLSITPRIVIEEEEQFLRQIALQSIAPLVATDVLKNPRLKDARELYGAPGDRRFALVDSAAWSWPADLTVAGFERAAVDRQGKRFLGVRIEDAVAEGKSANRLAVTVTLANAGGSSNGAVLGACTIRYVAREEDKGWAVGLAD
jgi:hypothetical protein